MLKINSGTNIIFDGNNVPHPDTLSSGWVDDVCKWPETQTANVILNLLESPSDFDGKALKAYKSTKAFSYYKDGWVKTCYYNAISSTSRHCFIKANILSSFKLNEKHHKTWVLLEKLNGDIITASCSCMAGLGKCCNHVAALLFKIEDAVKLGFTSISCTSMPCSWNKGCLKPVANLPLMDIQNLFKKDVHGTVKKRKLQKIDFEPVQAKLAKNGGQSLFENILKDVAATELSAPIFKCLPNEMLSKLDINLPSSSEELDFISCDGEVPKLNKKHKYYAQVQMQMAITNATSSDFVIWTTKNIQVLRVKFDASFGKNLQVNLMIFFNDFLCPAILDDIQKN
eukprot:Seg3069.3 transcript_id=Seg3069.3/GoldUCD/mRNA.D3Y31 product="hypothetical protein" protein_id=Seg3069.3/GoldUCD/D3Y31